MIMSNVFVVKQEQDVKDVSTKTTDSNDGVDKKPETLSEEIVRRVAVDGPLGGWLTKVLDEEFSHTARTEDGKLPNMAIESQEIDMEVLQAQLKEEETPDDVDYVYVTDLGSDVSDVVDALESMRVMGCGKVCVVLEGIDEGGLIGSYAKSVGVKVVVGKEAGVAYVRGLVSC